MRLTVWAVMVASSALAQEAKEISLLVGTQRVIDAPSLQRIAVADTSIADVKLIGNSQMLVIGAKEGATTLLYLTAGGERVNYLVTVRRGVPEITDPTFENGITVEKGQRATYKATGITAIEGVDPAVLAAKLAGGKLTVTGKAPGKSELVLLRGKLANLRMPVEVLDEVKPSMGAPPGR